jgi:cyclase
MVKKRLIGVVTVKDGWAVQSFGFGRYLPLGKPECVVENLDRWGADEIFVQLIDRSVTNLGPDYKLLKKLAGLALGTPLIYGGGIRTIEEGVKVIQGGADRISVDALLRDDLSQVVGLSNKLGAQAVIASMPMIKGLNGIEWLDYRYKTLTPIGEKLANVIEQNVISEILLIDSQNEGGSIGFDCGLIDLFPFKKISLLAFGGISSSKQMKNILARPNVVAVSVGNFLNYHEHAIQKFKEALESSSLRPSTYIAKY